jgi:hypothetical protein
MRGIRFCLLLGIAVVSISGNVRSAQMKATFSGDWRTSSGAQTLRIGQDRERLTVTDSRGVWMYRLDGSPSTNAIGTAGGETWIHLSQAKWVGNAVVITTTTKRPTGQQWDWLRIYRRETSGELVVSTLDSYHEPGEFAAMSMTSVSYTKN